MIPLSNPIRTVVAAPRSRARSELRAWLREEADIRLVGEAANGPAAVRLIRRAAPDLAILQVNLPGLDGFEVLETLAREGPRPAVVFLAADATQAVRAFHVRATDFLPVPLEQARLRRSLERVRGQLWGRRLVGPSPHPPPAPAKDRLAIRSRGRLVFIDLDNLRWAKAMQRHTHLHLRDGVLEAQISLGQLERQLPGARFLRINRSMIVRQDFIREIRNKSHGDRWVILETGEQGVLTRSRRARVLSRF